MEHSEIVICSDCGHRHRVMTGPGMKFLLLHCDKCGRDQGVGFEALAPWLDKTPLGVGPYDLDRARDKDWPPAVRSKRRKLRNRVERLVGPCPCGGAFRLDAPARCPECGSDKYSPDPGGEHILYD